MFLEQSGNKNKNKGWIEIITGSMFSGKTEELIRRVNRVIIAGQTVLICKPSVDTRNGSNKIVSHSEKSLPSIEVKNASDILTKVKNEDVIAIDEIQFFDSNIIDVCKTLANKGKRVIAAGLDMDYAGNSFGAMPELMAVAEYITKLHAICTECGDLANYSFRITSKKEKIVIGDKNEYTALCRECYNNAMNNKK